MRILLISNYRPDAQQSMQRYADWLERALRGRGHQVTVIRPEPFFSQLTFGIRSLGAVAKYLGYMDKFFIFPFKLRSQARKHDVTHILDHSNSMYMSHLRGRATLITAHDLLAVRAALGEFPEAHTGWSGRILQKWILRGLSISPHFISVSQKTSDDLLALLPQTPAANVTLIPNPLNWPYKPTATRPTFADIPEPHRAQLTNGAPYIFHVGANQWYKNRLGVLQIFSELRKLPGFTGTKLLMAGKPWTAPMKEFHRAAQLDDCAFELGTLDTAELEAYYSHALALLFASLEEGFGWPLLEAQACGCPVITSNRPPMNWVAGASAEFNPPAALIIDPTNPASAAATIAAELAPHRAAFIDAGFKNLARFDEAQILGEYCALYESIAQGK
jgi:glycosyltransferase involved in cell wall biosynthesis